MTPRGALHRQAAPFSRGTPPGPLCRPGRKAGVGDGRLAHRAAPIHIDDTYEAPLRRPVRRAVDP